MQKEVRYVVVTGGVLSGLGKGIFVSSLGTLLKSRGYRITPIKIDPYINIDAGTMNPIEHGEVFVLDDGSEVDMDLGNYERYLDINLTTRSNITTGKIFQKVIEKERRGDYLGKTVQLIPYVTNELQHWYKSLAQDTQADIVLIEVGGTVGDIENQIFLESLRDLSLENKVMFIHMALVPMMGVVGEQKTKPAQQSVRMLREAGIVPDMVVCRSDKPIIQPIREKISRFCGVRLENVISAPDVPITYELPLVLEEQSVAEKVLSTLSLEQRPHDFSEWKEFISNLRHSEKSITIAITGKYTYLKDSYASIIESLIHAGGNLSTKIKIRWIETTDLEDSVIDEETVLAGVDGIIVPGGFGSRGTEGKIRCIKYAREKNIPFLGLCLGFQLAVVEYARNVCDLVNAHTTEIEPTCVNPVISLLQHQHEVTTKGGTMRLGSYPAILRTGSRVNSIYGKESIDERHRHRFEVNPLYRSSLEEKGIVFSGTSPDKNLMEFLEIPTHKFFIATQAHPEFTSRPLRPNPLFKSFVSACLGRSI